MEKESNNISKILVSSVPTEIPGQLKTNSEAEQLFSSELIEKFIRKVGGFNKPDSLTKKEKRYLNKLSNILKKKENIKGSHQKRTKSKKRKNQIVKMSESSCKQRVGFDLSYFNENLMRYIDMRKCIKQIHRCYSINRQSLHPVQMYITSTKGKAEEILSLNSGYKQWDVIFEEESFLNVFKLEDIVYLTSDSENIIETLDDSKVYIIGGLLDHNSLKGLSYRKALASKISHGKLPIDKYMNMKTLKVLTVNQVFSIILSVANGVSWLDAFMNAIPQRKEAKPKMIENTNV